LVNAGRVGGRQASPGRDNSIWQRRACDRGIGYVPPQTCVLRTNGKQITGRYTPPPVGKTNCARGRCRTSGRRGRVDV